MDWMFWINFGLIGAPMFIAGYLLRSQMEAERRRAEAERLHPSRIDMSRLHVIDDGWTER